ncbi:hypothetical protein D3C71_1682770 [compost metagenome]
MTSTHSGYLPVDTCGFVMKIMKVAPINIKSLGVVYVYTINSVNTGLRSMTDLVQILILIFAHSRGFKWIDISLPIYPSAIGGIA